MLTNLVIPFLKKQENDLCIKETTFLHDRASCMSALATQKFLKDKKVDFFGNDEWPGGSPDINVCENLGAILKYRVEEHIHTTKEDLQTALNKVLAGMEFDCELFVSLLESYPERLKKVHLAGGGHIGY